MKISQPYQQRHNHAANRATARQTETVSFAQIMAQKNVAAPGGDSNVAFNSVLGDLLQQPELSTLEKFHLAGEAARRNLSNWHAPLATLLTQIRSIIADLSGRFPRLQENCQAWLDRMQPLQTMPE